MRAFMLAVLYPRAHELGKWSLVLSAHRDPHEKVRLVNLLIDEYMLQATWDIDARRLVYDVTLLIVT
jgi:hypothetical protein